MKLPQMAHRDIFFEMDHPVIGPARFEGMPFTSTSFQADHWRSAPLLAILGMVAAFAASLVFLIMQLPGEKDEHDDGARI